MIELKKIYQRINQQTKNKLQEIFDSINFDFNNLYNIADSKTKKKINTYIEEWEDKGLLKGQFGLLAKNIKNRTRVRNSEILELLIYGAYIEEQEKLNETELNIFKDVANYYYQEGQKEVKEKTNKKKIVSVIPDAIFLALLDMPNSKGYVWKEYIEAIIKFNADQVYRQACINIQQGNELKIDSGAFPNILQKQQNQKLCVNNDKISGDVDLTVIGINNQAKIEGIKSLDNDAKVVFLSNLDGTETAMCHSLNRQEFFVNKENEFNRYYGENPKSLSIKKIKCFGLVLGLNLPPINHHFHWCRSMVQYVPAILEKDDKIEYNEIDEFLYIEQHDKTKHKNYDDDYEIASKEYQQIPKKIRKLLYEKGVRFKFDYNRDTSGYNPKTKEVLLRPDLVEGELIHEIGHAIYYTMNVKFMKEYQTLIDEIFKNTHRPPIEIKNRNKNFFALDTDYKVNSQFQVYLGESSKINQIINNINNKNLPELFSEGYRCYYSQKEKNTQADAINKLIEKVENQC